MRRLAAALALVTGGLAFLAALIGPARSGDEEHHLAWRTTYREALLEARVRNVPVLVTRHTDD